MYAIDMEEPETLNVSPGAWQSLHCAWHGAPAPTAEGMRRRQAGHAGVSPSPGIRVRRIIGSASLQREVDDE